MLGGDPSEPEGKLQVPHMFHSTLYSLLIVLYS